MSIRVMTAVYDSDLTDVYEVAVLLALANHADDDGVCYPSMKRIAKLARMGERGVQGVVRRLCERGYLSVEKNAGPRGTNLFVVTATPRTPCTPEPDAGRTPLPTPPHPVTDAPAPHAPETSITIKEPSISKTQSILEQVLPRETAKAFIDHRKAKRAKMTDHAAELIVKDLLKSSDPVAAVEKSIKQGWTGVFIEQQKRGQNDKPTSKSQERMDAFIAGARGTR